MPDSTTGLFGKLPAHGDFVRRGLPRGFVAAWDDWLSAGIAASRDELGGAWDAAWEAAPAWRFRLAPGACGPDAAVGVMVTSADTVGRRFPLTLAAVTPDACPTPGEAWFAALEEAAAQGREGALDADAVLALLPPPPPEDPDATLDGRSLFWTAAGAPIRMPSAADFWALLGEVPALAALPVEPGPEAPARQDAGLEAAIPEEVHPEAADADGPPPAGIPAAVVVSLADLPFAEVAFAALPFVTSEAAVPVTDAVTEPMPDAADHADTLPFAALPFGDAAPPPDTDDTPHLWAETVDLPWATPPAPRNPEAGADA